MSKSDHTNHDAPWNAPLDELERELMDPSSWDESSALVYPPVNHPVGFRLVLDIARDEMRMLSAAAEAADMPVTQYVLHAALKNAKRAQKVHPDHDTKRGAA